MGVYKLNCTALILRSSSSERISWNLTKPRHAGVTLHQQSTSIIPGQAALPASGLCKVQLVLVGCYEPLTGPTERSYWELKSCQSREPKVVPSTPVNPVRIPLQWDITTPAVQGKDHIPGKNSTILKDLPPSLVLTLSETRKPFM